MTTQGKRRIDKILAPEYVQDLGSRSVADVRAMRAECAEEEALVSFERRLVHGRLAILRAELERRAGNSTVSLTDMLPSILADQARGPARGAFPASDPNLDYAHPQRRVSKLVSDDTLANVPSMEESEIRRIIDELEAVERDVSNVRKPLLDVLDALNAELARRYQTGEADPADVLSQDR